MLEWKVTFETGIEEIDTQHREIFRQLSNLLEACHQGKGSDAVGDAIKFLEDYTVRHFKAEEAIMDKFNYPDKDKHRHQHQEFLANFTVLKSRWIKEGPGVNIVVLANSTLGQWLIKHIMRTDKALAKWLRSKN